MIKAILKLFKKSLPTDPLALAQAKRSREAALKAAGASNKQARLQVAREFEGRKA